MFWNILPTATPHKVDPEGDDADYGYPYAVFAEFVRFGDDKERPLADTVQRLADLTDAEYAYDSGFTEGTFFYRTAAAAKKAAKAIDKDNAAYVREVNKRSKSRETVHMLGN